MNETEKPEGIYGFFGEYRWLSNFQLSPVMLHGLTFPSVENAYQFAKIDPEQYSKDELDAFQKQFTTCSPKEAKIAGGTVALIRGWDIIKANVMFDLLTQKFAENLNPELHKKLLATGDLYLEETNTWGDRFWGVCDGVGDNILGHQLMIVRGRLRNPAIKTAEGFFARLKRLFTKK